MILQPNIKDTNRSYVSWTSGTMSDHNAHPHLKQHSTSAQTCDPIKHSILQPHDLIYMSKHSQVKCEVTYLTAKFLQQDKDPNQQIYNRLTEKVKNQCISQSQDISQL